MVLPFATASVSLQPTDLRPPTSDPRMRAFLGLSDDKLRSILDPQRFVRWIFLGRLSLASAILLAALVQWLDVDQDATRIVAIAFAVATLLTAISTWWVWGNPKRLTKEFLFGQLAFDVLLVTSVVHVTGQEELSQFAALYILVNAAGAIVLPFGGSLLLAVFGSVLYAADVFWWSSVNVNQPLAQVVVFIAAALGISLISSRLQQATTSSQQLAAELTQASLEAADILSNIRSGILTTDATGALLYANPAASDLLGMDLQGQAGTVVLDHIAAVSPGMANAMNRAIHDHANTQREEAHVTLANREFPIGVTTTSNDGDGRGIGRSITAIFQDISDQKRVDQLRLRAERLEAVAELSASLAHEIKNPLASIRSAVEQLGHSPRATADEQTLSRLIVRESDRLSRLLSEFLDFARTRVTRIGDVDLSAIARGAANLAAAHPSRSDGVSVECVLPNDPIIIEGDEDLLHRAVFNLALNAVQAVPVGGHVRIDVRAAPDDELPAGIRFERGAVALSVRDDGPGIASEMRDRLFQPFATTKPGGSGLGLPVTNRAVEAHRGMVLVDSGSTGTNITVLLPRKQPQTPTPSGAAA